MSAAGPLSGLLVADFTRVLAGPLCTQMLGELGARVIKVEEPGFGDETRRWAPPFLGDFSTYFLSVNRNKESFALDLQSDEGRELGRRLVERADVVVDNFLPKQRRAFGLDDATQINPRVVHCSITGFDPDSADADLPGYDLLAQAAGGLMSINGDPAGEPMKTGVALTDVLTSHHALGAIAAALFAREKSGRGARLEISLMGATLAALVNVAQAALITGQEAKRYGNGHPSIVPYGVFHGSDRAFAMGGATDRHYRLLCERVIDRPDLVADERFSTNTSRVVNRELLVPILDAIFRTRPAAEWIARMRAVAIPCSLVQGVLEALHSVGAHLIVDVNGHHEAVQNPLRIDGRRLPIRTSAPRLGQHTDAIMRELETKS